MEIIAKYKNQEKLLLSLEAWWMLASYKWEQIKEGDPSVPRKLERIWDLNPVKTSNLLTSQAALVVKNQSVSAGDARDLGWDNPMEKGMATHSSILQLQWVGHDWRNLACMHAIIN